MTAALKLDQFRSAFRTGGLHSIVIRASGGQFYITAQPRAGKRVTLAATHGNRLRAFTNPSKAIEILHRMGALKVEVDTSSWSPELAKTEARKRPDTAERQRRAHQAAEHDTWFRSQVEEALLESENRGAEWDSQAEVKRLSVERRAAWLTQSRARSRTAR